jgi:ribose 5-phosphate isomerase RpiB
MYKEEKAMRIAVVSEVSARDKNKFILEALKDVDAEVVNIGMSADGDEPELTYIHTGLLAALALNTGAADFAVGGCGTGQGFLLSVMQYPGVYCGHIAEPLDAWLFSQINGGNCVSLALNKGFGWAGDINLRFIFEKLFRDPAGQGYPPHRSASQRESRLTLGRINVLTHVDFAAIVRSLDRDILQRAVGHKAFAEFFRQYARDGALKDLILHE